MNSKRILIFPFLCIIILLLDISCDNSKTYYFKWDEISLKNIEFYKVGNCIRIRETEQQELSPLTYGIKIKFDYQLIASIFNSKTNLIQKASAYTVPTDEYILKDKIISISIETLKDFNSSHLAGSDVSEYFNALWDNGFVTIDSIIKDSNGINHSKIMEFELNAEFLLHLNENPILGQTQQFEVFVTFESGNSLSAISSEIIIE
jgi:hypothetical protein